jgi:cytochrome c2
MVFLLITHCILVITPLIVLTVLNASAAGNFAYEFGKSLALIAFPMLCAQPLLGSRPRAFLPDLPAETVLGVHRRMALLILALPVAHATLMSVGSGPYSEAASSFPGPWPLIAGRAALLLVIGQLTMGFFARARMNYRTWRAIHLTVAPLIVIAAFAHSFSLGGDVASGPLPALWLAFLAMFFVLYVTGRFGVTRGKRRLRPRKGETLMRKSAQPVVASLLFGVCILVSALGFTMLRTQGFAQDKGAAGKESAAKGETLFKTNCAGCHSVDGGPSKGGPALKGLFKMEKMPASGRPPTDAHVKAQLKKPVGRMPPFGHLSDEQAQSIIDYIKSF